MDHFIQSEKSYELADFTSRFKAHIINGFLFSIFIYLAVPMVNKLTESVNVPWLPGVLIFMLFISFEALQVALSGTTLGHAIFGMRIYNAQGQRPHFFQALALVYALSIQCVYDHPDVWFIGEDSA